MTKQKFTILVVDENTKSIIKMQTPLCEDFLAISVIKAETYQDAVSLVQTKKADAVFVQIDDQSNDTIMFCDMLKRDVDFPVIPIVFLTIKSVDSKSNKVAFESNATAILSLPLEHYEFAALIRSFARLKNKEIAGFSYTKSIESKIRESEDRFKYFFDYSVIAKSMTLPNGEIQVNQKMCELLGYTSEELHGKKWQDITHPDDMDETAKEMKSLISGQKSSTKYEKRYLRKDGSIVWGEVHSSIRRNEDHVPLYFVTSIIDMTARKLIEGNLLQQINLFSSLLKILPVGVFMVDSNDGKPLIANEAALNYLGRGILPDANLHNLSEVYRAHKLGRSEAYPPEEMPIILGMQGISSHIDDMIVERPDGSDILLEVFGTPVKDSQGKPWASLVTFLDITQRKKAEENLVYLSYHDFLTGLYNRRFFEEEMKRLDTERNLPITVVMGDLNGLKLINDSFGHAAGDEHLKKAANVIKEAFRVDDIVSRIGGDEFAVLLIRTDFAEANEILNRLKIKTAEENTGTLDLSIAYGCQTKISVDEDILKILESAENHMYRQKLYERDSIRSKTIDIIMTTLFEKSHREMKHAKRVSEICEKIAIAMNLDKESINKVKMAGLVHDIGKIAINEDILNNPNKLSEDEWQEIRKHPETGWRILIGVNEFFEIANFVLDHHEKWNGSGYPKGLKGEEISLEARIIALADAYDAMTSDLPYRKKLKKTAAIEEIIKCSGVQFDPNLAKIFIEHVVTDLHEKSYDTKSK